jgi:GT2 family glycosyltransferase
VGGFDTRLITAEDVDLSWRVQLQTGTRLVYQRDAIIYHHHRSTLKGLARQYRQYGFGEILLDTLYSGNPGYPRKRRYHLHKLVRQIGAMVCYAHAFLIQRIQAFFNRIGAEEDRSPALWLLIEGSNIVGKIEGLIATRGMRDVSPVYRLGAEKIIGRYFQIQKE